MIDLIFLFIKNNYKVEKIKIDIFNHY